MSAVSLSLWRRRYGARGAGSKDEAGRGTSIPVEVHVVGPIAGEVPRYVLVSPAGVRMEVAERFKIEEVRSLLMGNSQTTIDSLARSARSVGVWFVARARNASFLRRLAENIRSNHRKCGVMKPIR